MLTCINTSKKSKQTQIFFGKTHWCNFTYFKIVVAETKRRVSRIPKKSLPKNMAGGTHKNQGFTFILQNICYFRRGRIKIRRREAGNSENMHNPPTESTKSAAGFCKSHVKPATTIVGRKTKSALLNKVDGVQSQFSIYKHHNKNSEYSARKRI